jgi:hypothetical protein
LRATGRAAEEEDPVAAAKGELKERAKAPAGHGLQCGRSSRVEAGGVGDSGSGLGLAGATLRGGPVTGRMGGCGMNSSCD